MAVLTDHDEGGVIAEIEPVVFALGASDGGLERAVGFDADLAVVKVVDDSVGDGSPVGGESAKTFWVGDSGKKISALADPRILDEPFFSVGQLAEDEPQAVEASV